MRFIFLDLGPNGSAGHKDVPTDRMDADFSKRQPHKGFLALMMDVALNQDLFHAQALNGTAGSVVLLAKIAYYMNKFNPD